MTAYSMLRVLVSHSLLDRARIAFRVLTRRGYVDHRDTTYQGKQIHLQIETPAVMVRVPADEAGTITGGEDPR
jgi:hypothetical protein